MGKHIWYIFRGLLVMALVVGLFTVWLSYMKWCYGQPLGFLIVGIPVLVWFAWFVGKPTKT